MEKRYHALLANLTAFFACLLLVGMVFAPFVLSLAMWFLVFIGLGHAALSKPRPHSFWAEKPAWLARSAWALRTAFGQFFRQKELLALSLLFWVPVASGLWSDDFGYWLERARVRLPFFVLPLAFANLPALGERRLRSVLMFLVVALVITCVGVGINYLAHFQEIMQGMSEGRPIPVPRNHIRFSLTLTVGVFCAGWLASQKTPLRWAWENRALWAATAFLFAFVHVLSVRSGLAALYVGLFFSLIWFVFKTRRWLLGGALLAGLLALPVVAVNTLPSVAKKWDYMRWDWSQFGEQTGGLYSDSGRMASLLGGWDLAKRHPLLGVGAGDLPMEMRRFMAENWPQYAENLKLPHNQFLYILASTGIVGLALSLWAMYAPMLRRRYRQQFLLTVFQVVALASFLVEYTFETAIGAAFFLFFQLWFLKLADETKSVLNVQCSAISQNTNH